MLVAVQSVVAVSAWRWPRAEALTALRASVMISPIAVVLVLTAVNAIWASRLAALLFVVLGVMALIGQRSSTELRRRYANLERLYRFAERTSGVSEVDDVVLSILRHAREVMGAGAAELVLPDRDACLCYSLDRRRPDRHHSPRRSQVVWSGWCRGPVPECWRRTTIIGRRWAQALAERGLRYALAAPITFGDDLRGVIIVGHAQGSGHLRRRGSASFRGAGFSQRRGHPGWPAARPAAPGGQGPGTRSPPRQPDRAGEPEPL